MSKTPTQFRNFLAFCSLVCILITGCAVKSSPASPKTSPGGQSNPAADTEIPSEEAAVEETAIVISPEVTPTATEEPTSTSTPEPVATDPIAATQIEIVGGEGQDLIEKVKADLATRLGVSTEVISLVSSEAKVWSDSSLGCPKTGMNYAQILTPGYQIIFQYAGIQYDYRTDQGGFFKLCQQ